KGERRPVGFAWAAPVQQFLLRRRIAVLAVAGVLAIGSFALLPQLRFDFNPLHLQNPHAEAVSTLYDLMDNPDTTPYTIDILAPSVESASALSKKLDALPEVARTIAISSFVPPNQSDKMAL